MQVAHGAVVLVADGRKLLFLRNRGDAVHPDLHVETAQQHPGSRNGDQASDAAGRASPGGGTAGTSTGVRSSVADTDFHQLEEDRFATEAADMLRRRVLAHDFEALVVVAPPRTLGELRKHYHPEVGRRLAGELARDLTGHPVADIEKALLAA